MIHCTPDDLAAESDILDRKASPQNIQLCHCHPSTNAIYRTGIVCQNHGCAGGSRSHCLSPACLINTARGILTCGAVGLRYRISPYDVTNNQKMYASCCTDNSRPTERWVYRVYMLCELVLALCFWFVLRQNIYFAHRCWLPEDAIRLTYTGCHTTSTKTTNEKHTTSYYEYYKLPVMGHQLTR